MRKRDIDAKIAAQFGWHFGPYHPELPHFSSTGDGMLMLIQQARKQDIDVWFKHTNLGGFIGVSAILSESRGYEETYESSEMSDLPLAMSLAYLLSRGIDVEQFKG